MLLRLLRYCKLHLFRDPRYFFSYLINYYNPSYVPKINYYNQNDIEGLIRSGKTIIRLGDGEVYIMNGGSLPFQRQEDELTRLLRKMVKNYSDNSPYVLCLNKLPLIKTNKELKKFNLLNCWLPSKVYFNQYFNKNARYLDAAMFYFRETFPNHFEEYLKSKKILFVSNKTYNNLILNNKNIPFKIWKYIETREQHSFVDYVSIKNRIKELVKIEGKNKVIILVAFGPASKAMAYDLSKEGLQLIDVGQGVTAAYTDSDHSLSKNIDLLRRETYTTT